MFSKTKITAAIPELVIPLWIFSVYRKAFSFSFQITSKCVILLISQRILRLLSFLIPLKVILIAGSGGLPGFIEGPFPNLELNDVVIILVILTVFCYISAIKVTDFIDINIAKASEIIADRNKKASSSINVPSEIKSIYSQVVKSLGLLIFIVCIAFVATFLDLLITSLFILLSLSFWTFLFLSAKFGKPFDVEYFLDNREKIQNWWLFLTYTTIFITILIQLIDTGLEGVTLNLIAIFILCRYAISAANEHITGSFKIVSKMGVINSLFFFRVIENPRILEKEDRNSLTVAKIHNLASQIVDPISETLEIKSIKSSGFSVYGVYYFDVFVKHKDRHSKPQEDVYILKIFQPRYHSLARHERYLLEDNISKIPASEILNRGKIGGFECVLLRQYSKLPENDIEFAEALVSLLSKMWSIPVTNNAVNSYCRTHECDIKRLNFSSLEILKLHSDDADAMEALRYLEVNMGDIRNYIIGLPLALDNPDLSIKNVVMPDGNKAAICYHWGKWSVQPMGSALSLTNNLLNDDQLDQVLDAVKKQRKDCKSLDKKQLKLSADVHNLLQCIDQQKYDKALQMMLRVVDLHRKVTTDA